MNFVKTLKKEKPTLITLPYGSVICVLSFRLLANMACLLWKTNEAEWWEINDVWQLYVSSRTFNNEKPISVAILSGNFPSYHILSKLALFLVYVTLMHLF